MYVGEPGDEWTTFCVTICFRKTKAFEENCAYGHYLLYIVVCLYIFCICLRLLLCPGKIIETEMKNGPIRPYLWV